MVKKNKVALIYQEAEYLKEKGDFRPSVKYPEYIWDDLSEEENQVYNSVREGFHLQGWDIDNYGSKEWNPLGEFIKKGDVVLIKPNLVMDYNQSGQGTECLYTQPELVSPVIDYVILALEGSGKIIVADAPMQECSFDKLIIESGYARLINYYKEKNIDICLVDMRSMKSKVDKYGIRNQQVDNNNGYTIVNLADESEHAYSNSDPQKFRVTNYDPSIMNEHHSEILHEYCVSSYLCNCDVIINMPKPKTHRKAGFTGALKNFVGINAHKEFLPHHTKGSKDEGGDEYLNRNSVHALRSTLLDKVNSCVAHREYLKARLLKCMIKCCSAMMRIYGKKDYIEGSWYGNNTISKTILDLNKIAIYMDKNGVMQENPQRNIIIVGDMIISGEKEGPVAPSPKPIGIVLIGTDQVLFDETVVTLMGFDKEKIPTLTNVKFMHGKYNFYSNIKTLIVSNDSRYNEKGLDEIDDLDLFYFEPTSGWKGFIEKA